MRDVVGFPQRRDLEGVVEFGPVIAGEGRREFYTRGSFAAAG